MVWALTHTNAHHQNLVGDSDPCDFIYKENVEQFVPHCSPFPVPCSLLVEDFENMLGYRDYISDRKINMDY
jgi:hypothetical protein